MTDPSYAQREARADQAHDIRELVQRLVTTESQIQTLLTGRPDAVLSARDSASVLLRAAQSALVASETRYRNLVTHLAAIVFELDPDGNVQFVSDAVAHVTGFTQEELQGRNWWEVFFPGEQRRQIDDLYQALRAGDVVNHELTMRTRDGQDIIVELSTANRYDDKGCLTCIMGFEINITERKRAEQQLRQAAALFESTPNAVMITDDQGHILAVNKAFTTITGYAREEVIGRHPSIMKSGRQDRSFYETLWSAISSMGQWQGEIWNRRKNGEIFPVWENISAVRDLKGRIVNYVSAFSDITIVKESQAKLEYIAHHDVVTGAANRLLLSANLRSVIERAASDAKRFALLFIDLDRFKAVNDMIGRDAGDRALRIVAERVRENICPVDTFARVGGDEFVIIIDKIDDPKDAAALADKIINGVAQPFSLDGIEWQLGVSIGISLFPTDGQKGDDLMKAAETAMYSAKQQGRNTYQFATAELTQRTSEYLWTESNLRRALREGQLALEYQPQVSLSDGRIRGVEALIRWHHPQMHNIPPDRFIHVAEESGLIDAIGEWVLRTACREVKAWGLPLRLSVNVSARQLLRKPILAQVPAILRETKLPPDRLELEFTESVLYEGEQSRAALEELRASGVHFAIDDFGTGYSSLSQLRHLPIDTIKIDRSFMGEVPGDRASEEIINAIIAMGHSLHLKVIAEGVENRSQIGFLRARGCDELQGFVFSAPLPGSAVPGLLAAGTTLQWPG